MKTDLMIFTTISTGMINMRILRLMDSIHLKVQIFKLLQTLLGTRKCIIFISRLSNSFYI